MQNIRLPYKNDNFGNPIYARLSWSKEGSQAPKPIALVYHAGGLLAGSSEIVPQPQIDYLCSAGFFVVMPNYRLAPQATAKDAFTDAEDAFDWATGALLETLKSEHGISLDASKVVAMGHSSGGTMVLNLASRGKPVKAVTALYPFLFVSDMSTNAHQPATGPPFEGAPTFTPTEEDWAVIRPAGQQLTEAPFATAATPRNRWLFQIFKTGKWLPTIQPDGDLAAIDPMTRLSDRWPPVMLVHGSEDNVSGRSLEMMRRAEREMKAAGVKEVQLEVLHGEGHVFDHVPAVGTTDLGPKWQAVVKGMEWLKTHI